MQDGQVFKDYIEIVCSDTDMLEVVTEIFLIENKGENF